MITELFKQDARGQIRVWRIFDTQLGEIGMEWGAIGGSIQDHYEDVPHGKAGRTVEEQQASRINSRINKQIDKGYVYSEREARENKPTNALGLAKPMLATPFKKVLDLSYTGLVHQAKYNGHRCMITMQDGEKIAYSRNGKRIESIPEILEGVDVPEGMTLDGELYIHGVPLQTIGSYVRRRQEMTKQLFFVCYDVIMDEPFSERYKFIKEMKSSLKVTIAPTMSGIDPDNMAGVMKHVLADGYEGLILRQDNFGYEDGKRSKGLVKVKQFIDDEFRVVDINPSADGWAVLTCVMQDGVRFSVTAPGTIPEKTRVMINKELYIGRKVNVQFAEFTKAGKPFHPVATMWRTKEHE